MSQDMTFDKSMVTRAVVSKIENETDPLLIRAKHIMGYETPKNITGEEEKNDVTPDITVSYEKELNIYEIELDKKMHFDKWRIFSNYAKKNNGSLILVVPEKDLDTIKSQIKEKDIKAKFIYFTT